MKKIKKIILFLSVVAIVLSLNTYASQKTYLVVNGEYIKTDVDPFIENGRTLVPIRFISENLDCTVDWNQEEKVVTVTANNPKTYKVKLIVDANGETKGQTEEVDRDVMKMELTAGSDVAKLYDKDDKVTEKKLDVAAKIVKGRTFVPVRFITETMGVAVDWDKENRVVLIGDTSKYDAEKFRKEVMGVEKPAKKEEKKEEAPKTSKYEGEFVSGYDGHKLVITKNEKDPKSKFQYIGSISGYNESGYELVEPLYISVDKDGKNGHITADESVEGFPLSFEEDKIIFMDHYWYKLKDGDVLRAEDGKLYLNDKQVPVAPKK